MQKMTRNGNCDIARKYFLLEANAIIEAQFVQGCGWGKTLIAELILGQKIIYSLLTRTLCIRLLESFDEPVVMGSTVTV